MRRRAMTFSETLIVAAMIGLALTLVALGISAVRAELRTQQTWELLATLAEALEAYHEQRGAWPVDDREDYHKQAEGGDGADGSAERVLELLHGVEASAVVLERVPEVLRAGRTGQTRWTVVDGWGHRLRCMTAESPRLLERQAVAANGGKPIFVSAGANGRFGTDDVAAAADNLLLRPAPRPETAPVQEVGSTPGDR